MAWCRWSTDSFNCDFYVYESDIDAHHLHIARGKLEWEEPFPQPLLKDFQPDNEAASKEWWERAIHWLDAHDAAFEQASKQPPGDRERPCWIDYTQHSNMAIYAGKSRTFGTSEELVVFAEHLQAAGFAGPSYGWEGYAPREEGSWERYALARVGLLETLEPGWDVPYSTPISVDAMATAGKVIGELAGVVPDMPWPVVVPTPNSGICIEWLGNARAAGVEIRGTSIEFDYNDPLVGEWEGTVLPPEFYEVMRNISKADVSTPSR